jgi:hypothetical protein
VIGSKRMGKHTKYNLYDVVMPKGDAGLPGGIILDYDFRQKGGRAEVVYLIFTGQGREWAREADLRKIGKQIPPLDFNQRVIVSEDAAETSRAQPGVITGMAWEPETDLWGFTVRLDNGETVSATAEELRPLHRRAGFQERIYRDIARATRKTLPPRLRRRRDLLVTGMAAPRTGTYAQVSRAGRLTRARTVLPGGHRLPRPVETGRAWVLLDTAHARWDTGAGNAGSGDHA